jgi:hypothetical protein
VRVEVGGRPDAVRALTEALAGRGITVRRVDEYVVDVETTGDGDEAYDAVRDLIADLGLRLYSLSSRHRSLDDLFLQEAVRP